MMPNGEDKGTGVGAGAAGLHLQAPRLQSGGIGYAAWRTNMDVFLQRAGAEGIHCNPLAEDAWKSMSTRVAEWSADALRDALALVMAGGDASSGSSAGSTTTTSSLTAEVKEARRLVSATVERSRKVFGTLYSSLPEELRAQAAHIAQGWAYGLWHWLETKFQSTEEDSVGALLSQWTSLRQEEEESFDAYRARVNRLDVLLEQAKEKQSRRMYTFMMLDHLQPRYKQAVLALKAGGQLKDAEKIDWDSVCAFINQHERSELRFGAVESVEGVAMAAAARSNYSGRQQWSNESSAEPAAGASWSKQGGGGGNNRRGAGGQRRSGPETRSCFRCEEKGHIARDCTKPPKVAGAKSASGPPAGQHASAATVTLSRAPTAAVNRYELLSSDDEDEVEESQGRALVEDCEVALMTRPSANPQKRVAVACAVTYADVAAGRAKEQQQSTVAAKASVKECASTPAAGPTVSPQVQLKEQQQIVAAAPGPTSQSVKPVPPTQMLRSDVPLDVALADDAWGWDTMASSSCSGNRDRFTTLRKCPAVPVKVADGSIVHATHIGSAPLRVTTDCGKVVRIVIENVLYHERFVSNLLSGELLTSKQYGWQYHSSPTEGKYVVTPGGNRVTLNTRGNIAVLMPAGPERASSAVAVAMHMQSDADAANARPGGASDAASPARLGSDAPQADQLVKLHERLCHMGWTRMMNLVHSGKVEDHGIDVASLSTDVCKAAEKRVRECVACVEGKATRTAFGHRGLDRGTQAGECLHLDTYQVKVERDGREVVEYGLVVMDMYSTHLWHSRMLSKDVVATRVIEIVTEAETQFGCKVKKIFADGGSEFIKDRMHQFCKKTGKWLRWTPARTQQLNGAAERTVRTSKDQARTMLQHAGAKAKQLWGWAASHAAYVWNRTHISKDTGVTPYELLRKKKPSLRHLSAVWGCDAYCHVPREQRGALSPKAEPCIYVGHSEQQNAANVLLLSTKKIICSRDVTYRSDSFVFLQAVQRGDDSVREAIEAVQAELLAEHDDLRSLGSNGVPAQGGNGAVAEDSYEDDEEYVVDRIVSQRKKNGRMEYKVRWRGYNSQSDTWEPEAEVRDLAAMDVWEANRPQTRHGARADAAGEAKSSSNSGSASSSDHDDEDDHTNDHEPQDDQPQVHMAMSALRNLQLPHEQPEQNKLMSAVAAGIATLEEQTPQTYRQAMASPDAAKWKAALQKEYQSCMDQKVWTVMRRDELPPGANVLPCKEVFKIKVNERGEVSEHKARITPKGFRQKHGVDFFETYARTGQYKTLRVALSLVAKWDHELAQFDVPTAFLNADVDEDIYMELPEGFEQSGMVCKLHKSLYGLKQAPRNWDRLVHTFITQEMAFRATVSDPSLYFKRSRTGRLMMIYRFVDDMQGSHHADDAAEFQECVALLRKRFNIKKLESATWMLGMRITRDRKARTITLDQELYVTKALERYGLQQCRVVSTPEMVGAAHDPNPQLDVVADRQRYMEITGTLMYAAISTRPDIAHAVHFLASNMQAPTLRHMQAAERVLRYLAGTKDVGLVFGSRNGETVGDSRGQKARVHVDVCAFADADWANDKGDRRSISGWVAKLNGDPVSWSSKKQRVVALSTCEAELYAESAAIQEVLWLRGLMEELGLHTQTGSIVYGDNQSAIAVSNNGVKGERTKHVDVKYHFVTETVERGSIKLVWVPTTQQQADIFTKALAAPVFQLLRTQMMTR
jgi:hypothetical protein